MLVDGGPSAPNAGRPGRGCAREQDALTESWRLTAERGEDAYAPHRSL